MNGKNLFRALKYVDDRYLDMVDAAAQEATDMKQKHFSGRKTILYILAAAICVSLLTVTAAAAGWIPNIFAAAQPKAMPRDEPVLEAAQSATQSQTPETVEFAEADYTKFTLFQSYYDGKSIALGYDLSGVMPAETVVGFTPEDALKQEILQRPDNQFWCERYGLTDDTADQYLEAGVWTQEEYDQRLAGRSECAKKYDLRRDSQIYMDDELRALLTDGEYKKFWIPNIFAAAQPKAMPRDEPVLEAAQSATQSQTPETVEFAEADYTKFTLFQSYYDGKSIALGYDLSGVMPAETVVGFTPEDALKQEILQRPDNQFWCERYGLTDDTADQYLEAGVWTQEEYDQRLAGRSECAKKYDLRRDSQIYMDDELRALLTDGEYKKFWEILGETGSCCVAIPMKPYVGDHILLNGADEPADRGDYTTEEGECLVLNNLPAAAQNQPSITVGLKFKSGWSYYYMELSGTSYRLYVPNPDYVTTITLENESKP